MEIASMVIPLAGRKRNCSARTLWNLRLPTCTPPISSTRFWVMVGLPTPLLQQTAPGNSTRNFTASPPKSPSEHARLFQNWQLLKIGSFLNSEIDLNWMLTDCWPDTLVCSPGRRSIAFLSTPFRFVPSSDTNSINSLNSFGSSGGSSIQDPIADSPPPKWGGGGGGDQGPVPLDVYLNDILAS